MARVDATSRMIAPEAASLKRASALAVAANLLWLVQAWAVAEGVSGLLTPPGLLSPWGAAAVFFAVGVLRAGLAHVAGGMLWRAADTAVARLRSHILAREAAEGPGGPAGATAALAGEKLELIRPWATRYAPARSRTMVVPLVILAISFYVSWAVGIVLAVTGPLIPLFMALVGWAAQDASEEQMDEVASLSDLLVDRLGALGDMRLLGASDALIAGFAARAETLRARTMAVLRIAFLSSTVLELFAAIGVAMAAVYLGFSILGVLNFGSWGQSMTPFEVTFLLLLAPEFYQPLRDLAAAWHDKAAAAAVATDLAAWEEAERSPGLGVGTDAPPLPGPASLRLAGLTLTRGGRTLAVPDLTLAPGQSLAIEGESGAGKTSLLLAIAGMLRPASGMIEVAGQPLTDANADAWRARLGWMPQAPHFLDRSLAENVGFDSSTAESVTRALTEARVLEAVTALPEGIETTLGETGGGLSGGEARRVTLARVLHAGPDLVLADEPTADLDAETASRVTEALLALKSEGRSLIVATHDPALAAKLDQRITLGDRP